MARKNTYSDIAKLANVSKSTVSKAFNGAYDVSEETRKLIFDAAQKISYIKKNKDATKKVGFMIRNTDFKNENDFAFSILNSFRSAAFQNNYEVDILNFDGDDANPTAYKDIIEKQKLSGAFIIGLDQEHSYYEELKTCSISTVILDNFANNEHVSCVGTDNVKGLLLATSYLVDLGHKRIGMLNGTKVSPVSTQRLHGYILGLETNGLQYDESLVMYENYDFKCSQETVNTFAHSGVSAIVCACDKLAIGLATALKELNIRVPQDISIIGYDNIAFCKYFTPSLSTIAQNRERIGTTAFHALNDLMNGHPSVNISIAPRLIVRNSCCPYPDKK